MTRLLAPLLALLLAVPVLAKPGKTAEATAPVPVSSPVQPVRPPLVPVRLGAAAAPLDAASAAAAPLDLAALKHVVFDVRGERGGHGDVAAGYLTAADLIDRAQAAGTLASLPELTMVAGESERRILGKLSGTEVFDGGRILGGHVKVLDRMEADGQRPIGLYLKLAAPEGRLEKPRRRGFFGKSKDPPLVLRDGAIMVNQTVFGNTESVWGGHATTLVSDQRLDIPHAGLGDGEAGVYGDPVARRLRGAPREAARRLVLEELPAASEGALALLRRALEGRALAGADATLAYGVSSYHVKGQFERYVAGLSAEAAKSEKSFLIVTPSSVKPEDIVSEALRAKVVFVDPGLPSPLRAEDGKVYILTTPTLPHAAFIGMMAYSGPPPIVSGDGAMSAAILLGRPFVMTEVSWNAYNVGAWAQRLAREARTEEQRQLVSDVFGELKLERAPELAALAPVFERASIRVPVLTDSLFAAIGAAQRLLDPSIGARQLLHGVEDPVLGSSLLARRLMLGDPQARELAAWSLRHAEKAPRRHVASAIARAVLDALPLFGPMLDFDLHPVNASLSRLVLWTLKARRGSSPYSPQAD